MRVLVVHNRYRSGQPSGENVVVEEEAALLEEQGCTVQRLDTTSDEIADWPASKRATLPLRVIWSRDGYRRTRAAINEFAPDVVHFHNTFPLLSPSALWAARRSGVAVVQTLHNFRPLCPSADFLRKGKVCEQCLGRVPIPSVVHGCYRGSRVATVPIAAMDALHGALATWDRCVDLFITPSEFARTKYLAAGWPAAKMVVKYNTSADTPIRREGAGNGFVCVSRLTNEKGVALLIDAWRRAFPHGGQQLEIIGSGAQRDELRARAADLDGVTFVGQLDRTQVMERIAAARAVVLPSLAHEVFPRVLVEAYSVGAPVISSRTGALEELVVDRKTGLLATVGAPDELADALHTLASSDALSRALGQAARAVYEEKYSAKRTTAQLQEIYANAIARRSSTRRTAVPVSAS